MCIFFPKSNHSFLLPGLSNIKKNPSEPFLTFGVLTATDKQQTNRQTVKITLPHTHNIYYMDNVIFWEKILKYRKKTFS